MRILAIRGKNLASLAGEFAVCLEQGALQNAGLFAITGPTGAGKSTILDALCLALYDQMPRLPDGHSVAVGHKDEDESTRIKSNDVSSILRRGTASAYAEVDFIGQDKREYRAHWEISRARGKVDGRLQAQKISLSDLQSNEKIGEGKKDTLKEISQRIGLTFDQFRRSVLLAQGDFAAFLKAKKDERSSLLEKITGTDIYSELSIAAFERAKQEKLLLDNLLEKLADKVPLTPELRTELEVEKKALTEQLAALTTSLKNQQHSLDWFKQKTLLEQEQTSAKDTDYSAQQAWDSQTKNHILLDQVEQAQPLKPLLQLEQNLEQEWQEAGKNLNASLDHLEQTQAQLTTQEIQFKQVEQLFQQAKEQHSKAQPLLIAARHLDTQLDHSQSLLTTYRTNTTNQQKKQAKSLATYQAFLEQEQQENYSLQQLTLWQEQHRSIQPLANEWGRWKAELNSTLKLQHDLQQNQQQLTDLQQSTDQQQIELQTLQRNQQQLGSEKAALDQQIDTLSVQSQTLPLTDLYQQKSQLEAQQETLMTAIALLKAGLESHSLLSQEQADLKLAEESLQTAKIQVQQYEKQQSENQAQLIEAQQALHLMQAASEKSAEELRRLLKDEQACPVCGSEQHPWAKLLEPIQQPTSAQQARVDTLQSTKEQLIQELSLQTSLISQAEAARVDLNKKITVSTKRQNDLQGQWTALNLDNKSNWEAIDQSIIDQLTTQSDVLKADYQQAKQQETAALKQQAELNTLRADADKLNDLYAKQLKLSTDLEKLVTEQNSRSKEKQNTIQRLETELAELLDLLDKPLSQINQWQDKLHQSGTSFVQELSESIGLWLENIKQQSLIEVQLQRLEKEIFSAEADKITQQTQYQHDQVELEQKSEQHNALLSNREQYFNGTAANDYAAHIAKQLSNAEKNQQQVETALNDLKSEIKTSLNSKEHWQAEQSRRAENKVTARQELDKALATQAISQSTLQVLLSKGTDWIKQQKERKQTLSSTRQESQLKLTLKTEQLQKHHTEQPQESKDAVQEQLKLLSEQQEQLSSEEKDNSFLLRTDDDKINAGKALQQQLHTQQGNWEKWESLNDLIGSSTGHKFRIFAQGLTLETLLSYTNQHLQEFARRYYLQRVPGSDLELQVIDRDMADDVRSVHSLSGGESFLVSLALALGLASLSSNKTQVESLFIDEGFGSLDQETLDIAIGSLDTLQALGRKVGVISHVAALVERIGAQVLVEKQGGGKSVVSVKANA
ncbi:MAG: AAA family ATPase [Methyloprofundus sp.]|nr:AAA family ATPase [Methyloprofundus sp.]